MTALVKPADTLDALQYWPLDYGAFEIRLLEMLDTPAAPPDDNLLRCRLVRASLVDPPPYHALSYCWGDPTVTIPIEINDGSFQVTTNLYDALQELRRQNLTRLWVDAICINQQDPYERGSQLFRMGQIYSRAKAVLGWIGTAADHSDTAMEALLTLPPQASKSRDEWLAFHRGVRSIRALFNRPYWRRKWIIQEVAKAKNVYVLCGSYSIPIDSLLEPCIRDFGQRVLIHEIRDLLAGIHGFRHRERPNRLRAPRMLLSEALIRSRFSEASDSRDFIYAMLGLTRDGGDVVPMPNYMQSVRDVLLQTTRNMVALQGQTALILLARRNPKTPHSLPSWVPDWPNMRTALPPWVTQCATRNRETWTAVPPIDSSVSSTSRILDVHAVLIERINAVAGSATTGYETNDALTAHYGPRADFCAIGLGPTNYQSCRGVVGILASLWDHLTMCVGVSHPALTFVQHITDEQKARVLAFFCRKASLGHTGKIVDECYPALQTLYCRGWTIGQWVSFYYQRYAAGDRFYDEAIDIDDSGYESGYASTTAESTVACEHQIKSSTLEVPASRKRDAEDLDICAVHKRSRICEAMQRSAKSRPFKRRKEEVAKPIDAAYRTSDIKSAGLSESLVDTCSHLLESSLSLMSRHEMRVVSTNHGRFRVVYDKARRGDLIFRLENCALPVVLRPSRGQGIGPLTYVGEVMVNGTNGTPDGWSRNPRDVRQLAIC